MVVPPLGKPLGKLREAVEDNHAKSDAPAPEDKPAPSIANTSAFRVLEQLCETGDISRSAVEVYKSKFTQLYNSLQQATAREKVDLAVCIFQDSKPRTLTLYLHRMQASAKNAKQLNNELLAVKITLEKESIARSERAAQTSALEQVQSINLRRGEKVQ